MLMRDSLQIMQTQLQESVQLDNYSTQISLQNSKDIIDQDLQYSRTEDSDLLRTEQLSQLCVKKIQKPKRKRREKCILGIKSILIPLYNPLKEKQYFPLNGNFCIYISAKEDEERFTTRLASQVAMYDSYLTLSLPKIEYYKDFRVPIKMLEASQDQEKYNLAQQLKDISNLLSQSADSYKKIQKSYSKKKEQLVRINREREIFRQELIKNYIKENFNEEDFFGIAEFCEDFESQQIDMTSTVLSKTLVALLGIEEKEIQQYFLHVGFLDNIFLANQERFYGTIYQSYKNFQVNTKQTYHKDFVFSTIDRYKIFCGVEFTFIEPEYPPELQYQCEYEPTHLSQMGIMKYNITPQLIKSILEHRQYYNNMDIENDIAFTQSIEYSFLSSILIDKFYPIKVESNQQESTDNLDKLCGYRYIK